MRRKSGKRAGVVAGFRDAEVHPLVRELRDAGDLAIRLRLEVQQVARADQADADESDAHAIVRAQHAAARRGRRQRGGGHFLEKRSACRHRHWLRLRLMAELKFGPTYVTNRTGRRAQL
jgi:hypothetical protein